MAQLMVMRHGRRQDSEDPTWSAGAEYPWDTPLVQDDRDLANAAATLKARGFVPDIVFTSPFLRCLQTAQRVLAALGCTDVDTVVHMGLAEVHNPGLLYKTRAPTMSQRLRMAMWRATYKRHSRACRAAFPRKARVDDSSSWPAFPESEAAAAERFSSVMADLARKHPGKRILMVSHGKSVQVAYEAACGGSLRQVCFCGYVTARAKVEAAAGGGVKGWADLELDAALPPWGVDIIESHEGSDHAF